jgi:hypothetical protein
MWPERSGFQSREFKATAFRRMDTKPFHLHKIMSGLEKVIHIYFTPDTLHRPKHGN